MLVRVPLVVVEAGMLWELLEEEKKAFERPSIPAVLSVRAASLLPLALLSLLLRRLNQGFDLEAGFRPESDELELLELFELFELFELSELLLELLERPILGNEGMMRV